jgi:hypothetical protein
MEQDDGIAARQGVMVAAIRVPSVVEISQMKLGNLVGLEHNKNKIIDLSGAPI